MINDAINKQVEMFDFYVRKGNARRFISRLHGDDPSYPTINVETQAITLGLAGDCFSITRPIVQLLQFSADTLPDWTLAPEDVPSRSGFIWFDEPISVNEVCTRARECEEHEQHPYFTPAFWHGYVFCTTTTGLLVYVIESIPPNHIAGLFLVSGHWSYGEKMSLAADAANDELRGRPEEIAWIDRAFRVFVSLLAFMQQEIVTTRRESGNRAARKRAAVLEHKGEIKVITLRRVRSAHTDDEQREVEWSCQWLVRGHWRLQPYKDGKRWRWIAPYVKGPDDKPLKTPTATIFEVRR